MIEKQFECKKILNKALEDKIIVKKDYEYVLKHIFKCNLLRIKEFSLIKKYVNDMCLECNELLSIDFFINDKILILWIARRLNHIIKSEKEIYDTLRDYLKYKNENKKEFNNVYYQKLYKRNLIECDDSCFDEYLPISTRDMPKKYSEFEDEINELNKYYIGRSKYQLNQDEINNIKEFQFCKVHEVGLLQEIKNVVSKYQEIKNKSSSVRYESGIGLILNLIDKFENIFIECNDMYSFMRFVNNFSAYHKDNIYSLMKNDKFHYNVNDDFFIIDKNENEIIEVKSFDDIISSVFIDVPQWIKYMQSHDICTVSEIYDDENYKV